MATTKTQIEKTCPTCKVVFFVRPSVADVRRCCSVKCQGLWKRSKRTFKVCKTCDKNFEVRPSDIKHKPCNYCSKKCQAVAFTESMKGNKYRVGKPSKGLKGEAHPNWKGGKANYNRSRPTTTTLEYRQWRKAIFERDNYTCQICEQYGGTLHADHIEKWADSEELRYAVDNGRTLCVPCHYYITFKRKMKPGNRWCNYTARKAG